MIPLTILSLQEARGASARREVYTHAIQILDDPRDYEVWPRLSPCSLRLTFDDVLDAPEHFSDKSFDGGCTEQDIARLIAFAGTLDTGSRLVCHCHAGLSRSPAAALIALSVFAGAGAETECYRLVTGAALESVPNIRMLKMADSLLRRGGALAGPGILIHEAYRNSRE